MGCSRKDVRKTIGIIINAVDENYQIKVSSGVCKSARKLDVNLVFFSGLALKAPGKDEEERNVIYHMIQTSRLDGLIIVTGTMEIYVGIEAIEEFVAAFHEIPIVSLSIPIKGAYNVLIDNKLAMQNLFDHLIGVHSYKRIAFISGPSSNQEALYRLQAYRECLEKVNIPYDDRYVYEGDYTYSAGSLAISDILNRCNELPEVVVAANDHMAIGALEELKKQGYRVPQDIAITGFDDVDSARAYYPSITTVAQPLNQMGMEALELICNVIDQKEVAINTCINGDFIVRESCGCCQILEEPMKFYTQGFTGNHLTYSEAYLVTESKLLEVKEQVLERLLDKMNVFRSDYKELSFYFTGLYDDLLNDLKNKQVEGRLVLNLKSLINYSLSVNTTNFDWFVIITWIRQEIGQYINHTYMYEILQGICYTALIIVGNVISSNEKFQRARFERMYTESRGAIQNLNMSVNSNQFKQAVIKMMNQYEIKQYYVCLYHEPVMYQKDKVIDLPETAVIAVGYGQSQMIYEEEFKLDKMLPDALLYGESRQDLIFYSLCAENEHFGYVVFDMSDVDVKIFETIREQISYTLKRLLLSEQRYRAESELNKAVKELEKYNRILQRLSVQDELTELYNRRGFYQKAEEFYAYAKTNKVKFYVIYGDMDGLKKINDQWGHQEGDYAIAKIADILKTACRDKDIIGRMGGDEFTIISPYSEDDDGELVMRKIEESICAFNKKMKKPYLLSISLGCVVVDSGNMTSLEALLSQADKALYLVKGIKKQAERRSGDDC